MDKSIWNCLPTLPAGRQAAGRLRRLRYARRPSKIRLFPGPEVVIFSHKQTQNQQ